MALRIASETTVATEDLVNRRALAIVQHQRVMDEAAEIAKLANQARSLATASPVYASAKYPASVRCRIAS